LPRPLVFTHLLLHSATFLSFSAFDSCILVSFAGRKREQRTCTTVLFCLLADPGPRDKRNGQKGNGQTNKFCILQNSRHHDITKTKTKFTTSSKSACQKINTSCRKGGTPVDWDRIDHSLSINEQQGQKGDIRNQQSDLESPPQRQYSFHNWDYFRPKRKPSSVLSRPVSFVPFFAEPLSLCSPSAIDRCVHLVNTKQYATRQRAAQYNALVPPITSHHTATFGFFFCSLFQPVNPFTRPAFVQHFRLVHPGWCVVHHQYIIYPCPFPVVLSGRLKIDLFSLFFFIFARLRLVHETQKHNTTSL
jgi:hypothetical protein